jgi:hypothetical protein
MAAELDIPDSSAFKPDTTEVARNWHFNIDQENYFNYLIKKLKIPIEPVSTGAAELEPDTSAIETEGVEGSGEKKGFLKGLFKRKKKESQSEEGTEPNQQDPKQNIGGEPE